MIIFLRHGQAENNTKKILAGRSPNVNLTQTGLEQAEQAGEMLKSLNISAIYTSPIDRALQTAQIVSKHCGLEAVTDDRLIELDMGKFTMMPYNEFFEKHGGKKILTKGRPIRLATPDRCKPYYSGKVVGVGAVSYTHLTLPTNREV